MMLCPPMSSPPYAFGRQSSPLNPYSDRSSSPVASTSRTLNPSSPSPMSGHRTRYKRPEQKKYLASAPAELFSEGTTPTEGQMWRETFNRRVQERERRRQSREDEVDKRRTSAGVSYGEEEDEEQARKDDEEIFRRLMVDQRRKARHAAEVAYERENGGSDPISPDFWDEQEYLAMVDATTRIERPVEMAPAINAPAPFSTPARSIAPRARPAQPTDPLAIETDADTGALEAARAEEAEREAEEAEMARQIEEEMQRSKQAGRPDDMDGMDLDIEMDWEMDSQ